MQLAQNNKPKPQFPTIKPDLLDRMVQQAETLTTKHTPKPKPAAKRWARLLAA